jgi:hypothetical protein
MFTGMCSEPILIITKYSVCCCGSVRPIFSESKMDRATGLTSLLCIHFMNVVQKALQYIACRSDIVCRIHISVYRRARGPSCHNQLHHRSLAP